MHEEACAAAAAAHEAAVSRGAVAEEEPRVAAVALVAVVAVVQVAVAASALGVHRAADGAGSVEVVGAALADAGVANRRHSCAVERVGGQSAVGQSRAEGCAPVY